MHIIKIIWTENTIENTRGRTGIGSLDMLEKERPVSSKKSLLPMVGLSVSVVVNLMSSSFLSIISKVEVQSIVGHLAGDSIQRETPSISGSKTTTSPLAFASSV